MVSVAEANELGKEMIEQYVPGRGYRLTWDRSTKRAGACNFISKEIILSTVAVPVYDWDEFQDLMLHEIAHALTADEQKDHGPKWKRKYKDLGGTGNVYCRRFSTAHVAEITPTGVIFVICALLTMLQLVGPWWTAGAAALVLAWTVKHMMRKSPAEEHGLVMVDGEWVST